MLGCLVRALGGLAVLALAAYGAVAVPIGRRTLAEHLSQIAATRPARELREDVGAATEQAGQRIGRMLRAGRDR